LLEIDKLGFTQVKD